MYQNFIIPYLYEAQHVSGDTPPIIRSLKLHWQPLVFHTWKVVGHVAGGQHCNRRKRTALAQVPEGTAAKNNHSHNPTATLAPAVYYLKVVTEITA
jgi:hypothetical protein